MPPKQQQLSKQPFGDQLLLTDLTNVAIRMMVTLLDEPRE
jgi:hypothetical protein